MNHPSKHFLFPSTLILGMALLFTGCAAAKKPMPQEQPETKAPNSITAPNYSPTTRNQNYPYDVAERAIEQANQVEGVHDSAVVISGNNIYLGLDLRPNLDQHRSSQIEKNVLAQVSEPDYTVTVSSDPAIVTRIQQVSQGISQGKPISSFKNQIEEIGTRIRPGIK